MGRTSIIAKRIQQARERARISSQAEVGILAGLHESGVSSRMNHYFKSRHEPKLPMMALIAAALHTPVPYFYCEDDTLAELILKWGTLNEEQKKRLLAFVDEL